MSRVPSPRAVSNLFCAVFGAVGRSIGGLDFEIGTPDLTLISAVFGAMRLKRVNFGARNGY